MKVLPRLRRRLRPLQLSMLAALGLVAALQHDWFGTTGIFPKAPPPATAGAMSGAIAGRATVVDGDTLAISGQPARVRLYGIDAPEKAQACRDASGRLYPCGNHATAHLGRLIGRDGTVTCRVRNMDVYQRVVAECETVAGVSLNREMVRAGWAIDFIRYSSGKYAAEQREAEGARRGLWAGSFDDPAQWR